MRYPAPGIFYNGPAVEGVNVTRRKHRVGSWYFSQKAVTVQGGYGAIFALVLYERSELQEVPAKDKVVSVAGPDSYRDVQSQKSRIWKISPEFDS